MPTATGTAGTTSFTSVPVLCPPPPPAPPAVLKPGRSAKSTVPFGVSGFEAHAGTARPAGTTLAGSGSTVEVALALALELELALEGGRVTGMAGAQGADQAGQCWVQPDWQLAQVATRV